MNSTSLIMLSRVFVEEKFRGCFIFLNDKETEANSVISKNNNIVIINCLFQIKENFN